VSGHGGEDSRRSDLGKHGDQSGPVVDQLDECVDGPCLGHDVAVGAHHRPDDGEGVHATAQHAAHDVEDDRQRNGPLLGA